MEMLSHQAETLLASLSLLVIPTIAFDTTPLNLLVRSQCLVISNSPSWVYNGPIIRIKDPKSLRDWEQSLGITSGVHCLDIVYFGSWDISELEPWKGVYRNYSLVNVLEPGQDLKEPTIEAVIKFLDQDQIHLYCPFHGFQVNVTFIKQSSLIRPIPHCPGSMSGQHFNVSGVGLSPPNAVFNNQGQMVGGVTLDVFNIMANALRFNYTFKTEDSWGGRIPNSTEWNGLVGSVRNQTSTIGIGLVFVDYNYYQAVDYLDPLWFYPVGLRSKKPSVLPGYGNLVRPFSSVVWIFIFVAVIFLMIVMVAIKYFEGGNTRRDLAHHGFLVVRILFSQSGNLSAHNRRSSKIFVGFWVMAVLFLSSMYECNLRAYLMLKSYEKPIETEQDIVDRGVDLYLGDGTPFLAYFRESQMEVRRQFWIKAQTNPDLIYQPAIADCLLEHEKVHLLERNGVDLLSPDFFLGRYPIMKANFGYEPFYLSKRPMFEFQFSFVLGKYQDFREDLNRIVRQLHASGILIVLPNRYFSVEALVGEMTDNTPKPFGLEHFVGAFVILGVGLLVSGMVLVKERFGSK